MTLKKLVGWAFITVLAMAFFALGRRTFGEETKYNGRIIAGDAATFEAVKAGTITPLCTYDKDLHPFVETLKINVPRMSTYSYHAVMQVYEKARRSYGGAVVWVTRPDDDNVPDGRVKNFCVAFGEPRDFARDARVQIPANSRRRHHVPVSAESAPLPPSAPADPEVRGAGQYTPERHEPASPLARWNAALAELKAVAEELAETSETVRAAMKTDLRAIEKIATEKKGKKKK